ncbi:hypothetical protein G3M48_006157 [Beauveria asiatica]|uniref:Uncharacterized protein n=1 Tax=Beauveria asiatica TaxID=1069075 RepID=A0AAW0RPQ5_9HYPO
MVRITPTSGMSYALDNSTSWFDKAVGIEETKRWIEKATLRGDDIYMIVGITTLTDASIVVASAQGQDVGGQINIPATISLAAAGIIVPLAGLIDPKADGSYQSFDHLQARYLAPGEQVCALQYRKVNHKWFSSRLIETSSLSKTRQWSCLEGDRRIAYEDEEDEGEELEDMIEVGLEDVGELDGEWRNEET